MPRTPRATALLLTVLVSPAPARASGLGLFQYGARATAEAGALTAGACDASAVRHNPAALAWLEGLQLQGGLGLDVPRDTIHYGGRGWEYDYHAEDHLDLPPAAYVSWRRARRSRWAFGVGLDAPVWQRQYWPPGSPSSPFSSRFEARVLELHPVIAFAIDKRWSVGAGIGYLSGRLRDDYIFALASGRASNTYGVSAEHFAEAKVDGWAGDVSVSFREAAGGFGAVLSSGVKLDGTADVHLQLLQQSWPPVADPQVTASIDYLVHKAPRGLGIDLAPELRVGGWVAPVSKLRLELDVTFGLWSKAAWDRPREAPICGAPCSQQLPHVWRDTLSIRFGVEHDITERFRIAGGVAYEPSQVSELKYPSNGMPGFPQGNALVSAIGASYGFPRLSFDLAYSFQNYGSRQVGSGAYVSSAQILSISARLRLH